MKEVYGKIGIGCFDLERPDHSAVTKVFYTGMRCDRMSCMVEIACLDAVGVNDVVLFENVQGRERSPARKCIARMGMRMQKSACCLSMIKSRKYGIRGHHHGKGKVAGSQAFPEA